MHGEDGDWQPESTALVTQEEVDTPASTTRRYNLEGNPKQRRRKVSLGYVICPRNCVTDGLLCSQLPLPSNHGPRCLPTSANGRYSRHRCC
jgi:hypothetical protein